MPFYFHHYIYRNFIIAKITASHYMHHYDGSFFENTSLDHSEFRFAVRWEKSSCAAPFKIIGNYEFT